METDRKKEYPFKNMPVELNEVWSEIYGHTFKQCLQLASLPDKEISQVHKGHLRYILNTLLQEKEKPEP